ncbi:MAG: aminomethyltransferase family protein [Acidobacteriota bacterium]|nr:aminomethyltransferase family protein [Acidobacteriota bacterium]
MQETIGETIEPVSINISPLDEVHRQSGATMIERNGWSVPSSYGDVLFEYAAVRERGAGLIDLSSRGRLVVSGSEAVQFLNGLITNDMKTLAENHWMPAAFPNVQGRLLASVRVVRQSHQLTNGSSSFLIDTEPATHAQVRKTIERFTLAGDFHVTDLTDQTALLSIQGADANNIVQTLFGDGASGLKLNQLIDISWAQTSLTIIRASHTAADGFDLIIEAKSAAALWQALIGAGARPLGFDALEILRVEAGEPRFGIDMDETNVVSETGLDDAVSFTKGCYLGQEIIARIKYRGHVAKKLSGLTVAAPGNIERDAKINSADGKEIGRVTSVTFSPHLGSTIALGYLKYDYLSPGTEVMVSAGEAALAARVVALPFVWGGEAIET